jgi:L-alanine-DL-glutamate epimerase-like enolase superfamily enzyme
MRITGIETIRITERPNLIWLLVHTDDGLTGLGETFFGAETVEAHVHESIAPRVIGADARAIDRLAADLVGYLGFRSTGAETRGNSTFDIALWDLWGRATGQPIAQLLGGFTRERIRTYNTCAGPIYIKDATGQRTANYGLTGGAADYDDLNGFLHRAAELALSLLDEGITAMKIWPFDAATEKTRGAYTSRRSAPRWATPWTSWSSSTRCGSSCRRCRSPARSRPTAPSGTRTRSGWTASRASGATPRLRPRRSAPPRRWPRAGPSATCSRPARPVS